MPEILLELSLSRSSGVLAGVVASLAQAGIELKSQKLQRATEGRGGWLTIVGEGDPPVPEILAQRLNGTRGVDRLMRITVDGETILAQQRQPEKPPARHDPVEHSAANEEPASQREQLPPLLVDDEAEEPAIPEAAFKIEEASEDASPEQPDGPANPDLNAMHGSESPDDGADDDLAAALETGNAESDPDTPTPEFAADLTAEDDLAEALSRDELAPASETRSAGIDGDNDAERVKAALRRWRRPRR